MKLVCWISRVVSLAIVVCIPQSVSAVDCTTVALHAARSLASATDRVEESLPELQSKIDSSLLTVTDPRVPELMRVAVYAVAEARELLQLMTGSDSLREEELCRQADVVAALAKFLIGLIQAPSKLESPKEPASDGIIDAESFVKAILRLNVARTALLSLLSREIVGARWAIVSGLPMFLEFDAGYGFEIRRCVLPEMRWICS